jgi:molybdate transport system regulatory protein
MRLSARNQLSGTIQSIKEGVVTAEVVVRLTGGEELVSVITIESVRGLGLKVGDQVKAVIKSTEVMIGVDA